jgi:hypothetical protein
MSVLNNFRFLQNARPFLLDCCPLATSLSDIPSSSCPENIGQIQRFWFVRKGNVIIDTVSPFSGSLPAGIASIDPETLAMWTLLFGYTNDDKVIKSPLIGGDSTLTAGTTITQGGGDNSTLNGETLVNGINPTDGSARFDSLTAAQIKEFRKLACEGSGLEVFLISQEGKIWGKLDGNLFTGFPCTNVVLGTMNNAGFGTRDNNVLTFQLDFDWDEYKHALTPSDFNALTV